MKRKAPNSGGPLAKRRALTPAQSAEVRRTVNSTLKKRMDYKLATFERTSAAVDYSGTVYDLFVNMARGDNSRNAFSGSHIQVLNCHIRGQIACADVSNVFRLILFQWNEDSVPVTTSILDNAGVITTATAPYATRNWSSRPNYTILRDQMIQLQANTNLTGGNGFVAVIDMYVKSKKIKPTYWAATSVALQKGGLYFLALSDSSAVTHPTILFTAEMVYTDE